MIVVRVAEHKEEDGKTQDQLVIGGSEDDGSYTGMYALLVAEQDESIGYRPRILAAPELDTEAVTKSLCVIAGKLRAFVYASCHGCNTMAEAITYRQKFNEREVMLLWPDFIAYNPKSGKTKRSPRLPMRAAFVRTLTMSRAGTNHCPTFRLKMCWGCRGMCSGRCRPKTAMPTASTTKKSRPLFVATGSASGATAPETNAYIFEVYTRTAQVLADSIAEAQFETIDSPLTPANVKDVISAIRAKLDSLVTAGKLIGAECWYDVVDNGTTDLRQGVCVFATNIRPFRHWKTWSFTRRLLMNSLVPHLRCWRCLMAVPKHLRFLRCLWMVKTKWVK